MSGVGSETDFHGNAVPSGGTSFLHRIGTGLEQIGAGIGHLTSVALGYDVASKIRDAYAFLAQNYDEGDEICLFGFSRGAYTVRKLSGLISKIGLLPRVKLDQLFPLWLALEDGFSPSIPNDTRYARIKCVGVWETVGEIFDTPDALKIKDNSLLPIVDVALHALSLHENRKAFKPTLWVKKHELGPNQIFKQVCFAGAHSDVGGGYARHELSDLALFWMAGEIKSFINLDLDFIKGSKQTNPDPWGTSQPHNAFEEAPIYEKATGSENRLASGIMTKTIHFHESVKYSPMKLTHSYDMITLNNLDQSFGSGWQPTYVPLNDFEQECKNTWGESPVNPVGFDSITTGFLKKNT